MGLKTVVSVLSPDHQLTFLPLCIRYPDPVPDGDHFKPFHELYGKVNTSEMHRPSPKKENTVAMATNKRTVPIKTSAQTANSVKSTVQCTECNKPRVLYIQKALSSSEKQILMRFLQFYQYTCGADIQTLNNDKAPRVCQVLEKVFVRDHSCCDDVELPYFSSKAFVDICVKCGSKNNLQKQGVFILCVKIVMTNVPLFLLQLGANDQVELLVALLQKRVKSKY